MIVALIGLFRRSSRRGTVRDSELRVMHDRETCEVKNGPFYRISQGDRLYIEWPAYLDENDIHAKRLCAVPLVILEYW